MQEFEKQRKYMLRAIELAKKQDIVEFFKYYLYSFQYPGAHLKVQEISKEIEAGIHFKPAQYILSVLKYAEESTGKRQYITKAEACHCIFNDLRCTRDNEAPEKVWKRITENRANKVEYDETGDVIRYAGDILDYMEIANLLAAYGGKNYYINTLENEAVLKFVNSTEWFNQYDGFIKKDKKWPSHLSGPPRTGSASWPRRTPPGFCVRRAR